MECLIPVINRLQDVFATVGAESILLPQIIVIGNQSSGKSSVIESIVGKNFLPRGSGIVTRRPLLLHLVSSNDEYGSFLHCPNKVFRSYEEIEKEIIDETNRGAGPEKAISADPIRLKLFSPRVTDLTLVDLPGLTKIPVGDQPDDIEQQIYDLVSSYAKNPNCIILAITAANTDLATSDSLKFAKKVDPTGSRTLAVITKLDLMDKGTNANEILTGKLIKVKLGIIGVVNRSQLDVELEQSVEDSLRDEKDFFLKTYPLIASYNGTAYLISTLSVLLMNHIRKCIPDLKKRVHTLTSQYQNIADSLGGTIGDKRFALLDAINDFISNYSQIILGSNRKINTDEIRGGARIYYIYHELFGRNIEKFETLDGLSRNDILTAIRNTMGSKPALFVSELAFELLVLKQIKKLEEPSLKCVELVHEEMQRTVKYALDFTAQAARFPVLYAKIFEKMTEVLNEALVPTNQMVKDLINMEASYINTNHPDFINVAQSTSKLLRDSAAAVLKKEPETIHTGALSGDMNEALSTKNITELKDFVTLDKTGEEIDLIKLPEKKSSMEHIAENNGSDQINAQLIELLIRSYMGIVKIRFQDGVPKAIACFLVNKVLREMSNELIKTLYQENMIDEVLEESPVIKDRREEAIKMLTALKRANNVLSELKDYRVQ